MLGGEFKGSDLLLCLALSRSMALLDMASAPARDAVTAASPCRGAGGADADPLATAVIHITTLAHFSHNIFIDKVQMATTRI